MATASVVPQVVPEEALSLTQKAQLASLREKVAEANKELAEYSALVKESIKNGAVDLAAKEVLGIFLSRVRDLEGQLQNLEIRFGLVPPSIHGSRVFGTAQYATAQEAMSARIAKFTFPTSTSAYEFPVLNLPQDNQYAESARAAGVRQDWSLTTPKPDFLVTRLDLSIVTLEEFSWNPEKRRLSRSQVPPGPATIDFEGATKSMTCLVAASGAGKTRLLFEKCYAQFGVYFTAGTSKAHPGSVDLASFLGGLPEQAPEGPAAIDQMRTKLIKYMRCMLLARVFVLHAAREACPGLQPRHWLALQLYPGRFVKTVNTNVEIDDVFKALTDEGMSSDDMPMLREWQGAGLRFVALDEAQRADAKYSNTFPSKDDPTTKRSALSPLLEALSEIPHVLLSGTGLGIQSAYETAISTYARGSTRARLVGVTTVLEGRSLADALRERGITDVDQLDAEVLKRFAGRPRSAMRLAEGLLLLKPPDDVARNIVTETRAVLLKKLKGIPAGDPVTGRTVYSEVRFAAQEWVLRGGGNIWHSGEIALEAGVCALDARPLPSSSSVSSSSSPSIYFTIKEPLVIEAFTDLPTAEFRGVTHESDVQLDNMLEDYVALNAPALCGMLSEANLETPMRKKFMGPWKLASPRGDQRRGISCGDGEEPAAIKELLKNAGGSGPSIVFPGVRMGADVVFAALRESDRQKLLVFVQVKASTHASGPGAMKVLTHPYHENRDSEKPAVPANLKAAYNELNTIICDANTSVALFIVVKQPGNVRAGPFTLVKYASTQVLEVYLDGKHLDKVLPEMKEGLHAMETVKKARIMGTDV